MIPFIFARLIKIILVIGLIQLLPVIALSQVILRGYVEDGVTNKPLTLASIFLSNTTAGTITDEEGKFSIKNAPAGNYDLIVSCIG